MLYFLLTYPRIIGYYAGQSVCIYTVVVVVVVVVLVVLVVVVLVVLVVPHENKVKPNCQSSVKVGWSCQLDLGLVLTKIFIFQVHLYYPEY